uniref:Uncharacterized protein n=1 Tax=Kalanchoe fedtschenkoi TaxID=63787 RepID=A0A7N0TJW8_KALFE
MGFGKWGWVSAYSRSQCRRLFFRARAALKRALKSNGCRGRDQLRFQYDPWSYALNFDDGCSDFRRLELRSCRAGRSGGGAVLVIVLWVNPVAKVEQ